MLMIEPSTFWAGVPATLTAEQRKAIAHVDGPLLVVAGPGSGKTTVITYRAAYLTQVAGVDPAALLVVTFTKAAADSMKARTARVAGSAVAARATFGTFHALAFRMLTQANPGRRPQILDEDQQLGLIRQLMRHIGLNTDDDTVLEAVAEISRMRATTQKPAEFKPHSMTKTDFKRLFDGYQEAKAQKGAMDFDDLLHEALTLLKTQPNLLTAYRRRYTHIMVDEFQDTNPVQWELVQLLASPLNNLCVVGDDDQSIYGWRGASPAFLLGFPMQFPSCVRVTLDLNHRCPPPVVEASNRLAACNRNRFGKVIKSGKPKGLPVQLLAPADSLQEAEEIVQLLRRSQVPLSDWAVIYRTNQQAHAIAQVLAREEVPYRALGGLPNLYRRWPVQDVLCYLRAATGRIETLEGVINRPNRYMSRQVMQEAKAISARTGADLLTAIGETGLLRSWQFRPIEELMDHLRRVMTMTAPEAISYVRRFIGYDDYIQEYSAREGGSADEMLGLLSEVERTSPKVDLAAFLAQVDSFSSRGAATAAAGEDAVTLVTCHKAKGLEFPRVIVVGATDKLMPHRGSDDVEEERRLMYVAMTRAVERLWISSPGAYEGRESKPSPFIAEALGAEAEAWLAAQHKGNSAPQPPAPEPVVRAVPKPATKKPKSRRLQALPDSLEAEPVEVKPGTKVFHERHGEGTVESVDLTLRRVIIDFDGKRMSLDLTWCLATPQFFRVL
ncbi:MAG TPA: ATP-dependent helicase [Symbiobacteriaceae bacterium]|nr:ATP-dependent helicase [Symbiobacteriaceae bacterium]